MQPSKLIIPLFLLLCVAGLSNCVHSQRTTSGSYSVFKQSFAGAKLGEDGKGERVVDTIRTLYIQCKGATPPVIDSIMIKGQLFGAKISKVEKGDYHIGKRRWAEDNIILKGRNNAVFWRLDLWPLGNQIPVRKSSAVIILGKCGNTQHEWNIADETELEPDIRM